MWREKMRKCLQKKLAFLMYHQRENTSYYVIFDYSSWFIPRSTKGYRAVKNVPATLQYENTLHKILTNHFAFP